MNEVHVSKVGTHHPNPNCTVAWTINDTRGTIDGGPACDECGACECDPSEEGDLIVCPVCGEHGKITGWTKDGRPIGSCGDSFMANQCHSVECIGLSFCYVCLDGGDTLCVKCAEKEGITITSCNCEDAR